MPCLESLTESSLVEMDVMEENSLTSLEEILVWTKDQAVGEEPDSIQNILMQCQTQIQIVSIFSDRYANGLTTYIFSKKAFNIEIQPWINCCKFHGQKLAQEKRWVGVNLT